MRRNDRHNHCYAEDREHTRRRVDRDHRECSPSGYVGGPAGQVVSSQATST
jgi:hypothetical protein